MPALQSSAHGGAALGHATPEKARANKFAHATQSSALAGKPPVAPGYTARSRSAFTLVEMIVVIAIILIVVGISLPSVTSMWDDQKVSEAENKIQGLLMTTRSRSVSSAEGEHGILAYLDEDGAQRLIPIAQATVPDDLPISQAEAYRLAYIDVFAVQDAYQTVLPKPLRVVPRSVVIPDAQKPADRVLTFSNQELTWTMWRTLLQNSNQAQRHRNYFAMIFSADGQLLDRRNVLIQDVDRVGGIDPATGFEGPDGKGDLTGLPTSYDIGNKAPIAYQFYDKSDDNAKPLDPTGSFPSVKIPFLVVSGPSDNDQETAINFPTVDGMLLYDDRQFQEVAGANGVNGRKAREYLLNTARPLYVNRNTGAIIRGPIGEGEQTQ